MLKNLKETIKQLNLTSELLLSKMGVEVEEHRLKTDGHLSDYPYPSEFGSRNYHPTLQSDFGESQMELVTIPKNREAEVLEYLDVLQSIVQKHLRPDEVIWPLSMPPRLSTTDKQFISTHFGRPKFQSYRDYLKKVYGVEQELITGLHINVSIPETIFEKLYNDQKNTLDQSFVAFKNELYFRISQNMALDRWLITYFFGASPITENHYWRLPADLQAPVRSIRSSSYGFSNTPDIKIGYQSLRAQIDAIDHYIANNQFFSTHEFYGPVRVKAADDLTTLEKNGIKYLEMRMFDLDPYERDLVGNNRLLFIKLMVLNSLIQQPPADMDQAYTQANQLNEQVALGEPHSQPKWFKTRAKAYFDQLYDLIATLDLPAVFANILTTLQQQIDDPQLTLGARVADQIQAHSLVPFGLKQGQAHFQAYLKDNTTALPVLADKLSPSQQLLVERAIIHGLDVDWSKGVVHLKCQRQKDTVTQIQFANARDVDAWLIAKFGTIKQ
ncbi:glutamate-cysteine ligase [Agrilactobacillus composti DSM 18527 = JCM 14202]|uniref:Glutamate--cysteine ligase n=1 Tax=Agrilactobacillus composti DSM 18527 = JCM 14202 TaxID=1423734 RepID=A0A0R1XND4_9LACO|nr:hypothetical protein [Agrilactobacillus composti]KRM31125.1 glutamate-cysteine ligase [Agrilactobacillus composti DSM 18527 = JCM 14202]